MFKRSIVFLFTFAILTSCSTHEIATFKTPKKNERLYFGNVFIEFNGLNNTSARCDVFTNSSLTAEFKTSDSGFISFVSTTKKQRITEIACLLNLGREKQWIHYPINMSSLQKTETSLDVSYFGDIYIKWTVEPEDIEHSDDNKSLRMTNKISGKGDFKIEVKDNSAQAALLFKQKYIDLQNAKIINQIYSVKE